MPLYTREVTEAMKKANQANSQKSTGPRTEQGKLNSRGNSYKHGFNSHTLDPPWSEALDEDSAQYRRHCRRMLDAFQVRDAVEELLVGDMARTRWRLDRVLHAEAAHLAYGRASLDNDLRQKLAGEDVDLRTVVDRLIIPKAGYSALRDTEGKFELILLFLATLRAETATQGYTETGRQCLQLVYGPKPGVAAQLTFVSKYKELQPQEGRSAATQEQMQRQFLVRVEKELETFKTLRHCMREKRGALFDMLRDTRLLLPTKAAKRVAAEETRLRKYFYQTMNQLLSWRKRAVGDGPPSVGLPQEGRGSFSPSGSEGLAVILPDESPADSARSNTLTAPPSPATADGDAPVAQMPSPASIQDAADEDPCVAETLPSPHATVPGAVDVDHEGSPEDTPRVPTSHGRLGHGSGVERSTREPAGAGRNLSHGIGRPTVSKRERSARRRRRPAGNFGSTAIDRVERSAQERAAPTHPDLPERLRPGG
jgi:hypothetical protein